ncbi:sulfurtransferase TusA family protein [Neptunomonas marina]|uniref:sulfurtransferase TusA family protein n=1 Tax=Neptunomonas marina TaxID=1815562 RepID=UPI001981ECBF|nr:sulfurtransferase TusA family protein [Neptunomonas marina]
MPDIEVDEFLDASGLNCPMPLLKTKQKLNQMVTGELLKVIATDGGSQRDFKAFTDQSDHELIEMFTEGGDYIYVIRRG